MGRQTVAAAAVRDGFGTVFAIKTDGTGFTNLWRCPERVELYWRLSIWGDYIVRDAQSVNRMEAINNSRRIFHIGLCSQRF